MNNLFDIACNFSSDRFDKDLDAVKILAQGTLTSFQLHIGQEEWDKLVEELKDLEKRDVEQ